MSFGKFTDFAMRPGTASAWIEDFVILNTKTKKGIVNAYMRHSQRSLNGEILTCVDVANITVNLKGQGVFTRLMRVLESLPINIYIENVHNERLATWFANRDGYTYIKKENYEEPPCYIRKHVATSDVFKPCPWCGKKPDVDRHFDSGEYQLIHRCYYIGSIQIEWDSHRMILAKWNHREADFNKEPALTTVTTKRPTTGPYRTLATIPNTTKRKKEVSQ